MWNLIQKWKEIVAKVEWHGDVRRCDSSLQHSVYLGSHTFVDEIYPIINKSLKIVDTIHRKGIKVWHCNAQECKV